MHSLPFVLQQLFSFFVLLHSAFKFGWPKRVAALAGGFGRLAIRAAQSVW